MLYKEIMAEGIPLWRKTPSWLWSSTGDYGETAETVDAEDATELFKSAEVFVTTIQGYLKSSKWSASDAADNMRKPILALFLFHSTAFLIRASTSSKTIRSTKYWPPVPLLH